MLSYIFCYYFCMSKVIIIFVFAHGFFKNYNLIDNFMKKVLIILLDNPTRCRYFVRASILSYVL